VAELRELVTRLVERVSALEASEGFELVPELARGPASRQLSLLTPAKQGERTGENTEGHRELCKRGPDTGRSIFVGLPSQWEVLIALREAEEGQPGLRSQPHAHFKVRVWLGLLSGSLEQHEAVPASAEEEELFSRESVQAPVTQKPKKGPTVGAPLAGLDPTVVAAARAAGVPEDQLKLMEKLAAKPGKLGDGCRQAKTVLSESEEDEPPELGEEGDPGSVAEAICKMTQILSKLSKPRRGGSLEDLLDRSDGSELGQGSSSSGGSSKAAAYQKLTRLLKEDPAKISSSILRLMAEDFQGHVAAPGLEAVGMTTRAWLEHRSRVQQFAAPVRWGWQTAGALDALLSGREEECKARLCLMLCALDQSSLDAGSWLLAAEMLLEPPPPFSSFSKHRAPEPGESHEGDGPAVDQRDDASPTGESEKDKPEKPPKGQGRGKGEATAVQGSALWNDFFTILGRAKTPLSSFWHSLRIASPGAQPGPKGRVWPMPMPFPSLHQSKARRQQPDASRKLALNATVLVLSWLYLGQPASASSLPGLGLGTPLSSEQWQVVRTLGRGITAWNSQAVIGPEEMGRSAAKVESCERILEELQRQSRAWGNLVRAGASERGSSWVNARQCGKLDLEPATLAQPVVADRLKFVGSPTFDASPYLDNSSRAAFERPLDFARHIPDEERVPYTNVRCSRAEALKLLELLDGCDRLALLPSTQVRLRLLNGLFTVPKSLERDRMVLDARAANQAEEPSQPWIRSLASLEQLQWLHLSEHQEMTASTEDLREFYHAFRVGEQRSCRNALGIKLLPREVSHLRSFTADLWDHPSLHPCLKTMAMGDSSAVGFGQCAHLSVLLRSKALSLEQFVTLSGRPPRQGLVAGLL
ncbi:unnamed protein product, partial [Symbiodinium sp. KB8]